MSDPISQVVGGISDRNQAKSGARAANAAATVQKQSIDDALNKQTEVYNANKGYYEPTYQTGLKAGQQFDYNMGIGNEADYTDVNKNIGSFGSSNKNFGISDFYKDPEYDFTLKEGEKALERGNAARRNYFSGDAQKGLSRYNQDYASTKFNSAENRYNKNRDDIYNRFKGIKDEGYNAGVNLANMGTGYANTYGDLVTNKGDVTASAIGKVNEFKGQQRAANALLTSQGINAVVGAATGGMGGGGFAGAAKGFYNGAGMPMGGGQDLLKNSDIFAKNFRG